MAGAGYKLFTTGQVLTAAEVNTYLQEQTVMVFNDAASRTTALSGVLAEGMVSYLKSTKVVEIYNGTAWASLDDPNAIQNTIVDAKGDLITATANDVPARLAVGNNGETLVADSSTSTGLRWQGSQAAGRNFVINGGMDIWQRGTSISRGTYAETFLADRWYASAGAPFVVSRESTIVPSGFQYSQKITGNGSSTPDPFFTQIIETSNAILLAGQTVTLSAYMYATSTTPTVNLVLSSSTTVDDTRSGWTGSNITPTRNGASAIGPNWTRISSTFVVPSNAKTLMVQIQVSAALSASNSFYFTGVQLELGSVPTAFQRAGGNIAGELAACQRYYYENTKQANRGFAMGQAYSTTQAVCTFRYPVTMRSTPTISLSAAADFDVFSSTASRLAVTAFSAQDISNEDFQAILTVASGLTAGNATGFASDAGGTAAIKVSAEL